MTFKIKNKPIFIAEPYGLPRELQEKDKFDKFHRRYLGK